MALTTFYNTPYFFRQKSYFSFIALLLVIIQSIGIRFFSGQGSVLTVVIIFLSYRGLIAIKTRDVFYLITIFAFLVLNNKLNESTSSDKFVYQCGLVFSSYVFLLKYKSLVSFENDFYLCLKLIFYHALIGFILYLVLGNYFSKINFSGYIYQSFLNLFFVSTDIYGTISRNTGICWEPGLLQLVLNLYLFFSIKYKRPSYYLIIIAILIITTFSTTGYFIIVLNYIFYLLNGRKSLKVIPIVLSTVFFYFGFLLIGNNASSKFQNTNTSALIRLRDYYIGLDLIQEKPFMGHGIFDEKYLLSKPYVHKIETSLFTNEYLNENDDLSGGYTNGLLGLLSWYGLPVGIYLLILFFRNRIVHNNVLERIVFFLIFSLTFLSEPITYTPLFLLFPFSVYRFRKITSLRISDIDLNTTINKE